MSKYVEGSGKETKSFREAIQPLTESQRESLKRAQSSRLHIGLKAITEEAYKKGLDEGFDVGYQDGLAKGEAIGLARFEAAHSEAFQEFRDALEAFVSRIEVAIDDWYMRAEDEVAALTVQIAERAICRELEQSRESVYEIVKEALECLRVGAEVRVRLNPLDVSVLYGRREQLIAEVANVRSIEIVPDLKIESGCEIETTGGVIDGRISTFLNRLQERAA